jgi:iron-sulfur cluster repair protein YtfE (RIC family)
VPNFRDWTASEIVVQMPQARNILAKHFGPEGIGSGSHARLRELAAWKGVDLESVMRELNAAAKSTGFFQ